MGRKAGVFLYLGACWRQTPFVPHCRRDTCSKYFYVSVPDDKNMTAELDWYMSLDHNKMARASTGIDNTKHADEIDPVYIALCNGEELRVSMPSYVFTES